MQADKISNVTKNDETIKTVALKNLNLQTFFEGSNAVKHNETSRERKIKKKYN